MRLHQNQKIINKVVLLKNKITKEVIFNTYQYHKIK